jgi:hypothetical protein
VKQWCISPLWRHMGLDSLSRCSDFDRGEPWFTYLLYRCWWWGPLSLIEGIAPDQGMGGGLGPLWPCPLEINSNICYI